MFSAVMRTGRLLVLLALGLVACSSPKIDEDLGFDELEAPADFSCANHAGAIFCDDFDTSPLAAHWSGVEIIPSGNGVVEARSDDARSEPNTLVASIGGSYDDDPTYAATLVRQSLASLAGEPYRARISFQLKVDEFDAAPRARVSVFQLLFGDLEDLSMLTLNLESTGGAVAAQFTESNLAGGFSFGDLVPIDSGEWVQVSLTLDITSPNGGRNRVALTLDDRVVTDVELTHDLPDLAPRLELGLPWVDTTRATEPWQVRFDNVLVEVEPT
jgi:hypothetical protein